MGYPGLTADPYDSPPELLEDGSDLRELHIRQLQALHYTLQKELLLNKEVLSVNQADTAPGRLVKDFGTWRVYSRLMGDISTAVAFYNPSDTKVFASVAARHRF